MSQQGSSGAQQYFLGMGGEQTGPFAEVALVQKIQSGQVASDALIWYEGLPEWQPIKSVPALRDAFTGDGSAAAGALPSPGVGGFKPHAVANTQAYVPSKNPVREAPDGEKISTFANDAKGAEPVFDSKEAIFSQSPFIKYRAMFIVGGLVGVLGLGVGGFYLFSMLTDAPLVTKKTAVNAAPAPDLDLRKALSELLINPGPSLETLSQIAREHAADDMGKQALEAALEYYRNHAPSDAGRLLVAVKKSAEAVPYFLMDPPSYAEAEQAAFAASSGTTDLAKKKQFLLQDIQLLLGQVNNVKLATERLKLFEKTFPGESHRYAYYLKTTDERIKNIFDRIAFYFLGTLQSYLHSELPQINFMKSPLVELKKDKLGRYRVTANYVGEVLLNNDRLTKIRFTFWLSTDRWHIIDTNITSERKVTSTAERDRMKDGSLSGDEMIAYLEQIFKTQNPKTPLHEKPAIVKATSSY